MSEASLLSFAVLIVFGAAFVQGVTGFGHALVAIGLLSLLLGPKQAVLVLTLLAPVISAVILVRVRKSVEIRETLRIAIPLCIVGLPLGIWLFSIADPGILARAVGVLLVVSAGYFLSPFAPSPKRVPPVFAVLAGFTSGFLNGFASTGGPPLVLYLYARKMDKEVRLAVLQAVFVASAVAKVAEIAPTGLLTGQIVFRAAVLVPPLVVGVFLGHLVFRRLPAEALRRGVLVFLSLIGAALIVKG